MNISGLRYSKQTRGMKQPSVIQDQDFDLVFVYPVLASNSVSKYSQTIRDFISLTMLKEVYVNNALNIVSMAASPEADGTDYSQSQVSGSIEQITKPSPDHGQRQESLQGGYSTGVSYEFKSKIKEKTNEIQKYLTHDPKLKTLRPYLEIITLENMVEVPVIVGTKQFPLDDFSAAFMLLVASTEKLSLGKKGPQNIKKIEDIISKTSTEEAFSLFNSLIRGDTETASRLESFFERHPKFDQYRKAGTRKVSSLSRSLKSQAEEHRPKTAASVKRVGRAGKRIGSAGKGVGKGIKTATGSNVEYNIEPDETFAILNIAQDNLDQAVLFFKFCLDSKMLENQVGVKVNSGEQVETALQNIDPRYEQLFDEFETQLLKDWATYADGVLTSFCMVLYPPESGIDSLKIMNDAKTNFFNAVQQRTHGNFKQSIRGKLTGETADDASKILDNIEQLCTKEFEKYSDVQDTIMKRLDRQRYITNPNYTKDQLEEFNEMIEQIGKTADTEMKRVIKTISKLTGEEFKKDILDPIEELIYQQLLNPVTQEYSSYSSILNANAFVDTGEGSVMDENYIDELKYAVAQYFKFIFLFNFQKLLCSLVDVAKVSVDTAKYDVLDFPNYTLLLPLETVMLITNALAAKNYRQLINQIKVGEEGDNDTIKVMRDIKQNHIKGVVEYFNKKLEIPNLFVIDEQRGDVYYQMMHQSKPQKTGMKSIESFIQNAQQSSQQSDTMTF